MKEHSGLHISQGQPKKTEAMLHPSCLDKNLKITSINVFRAASQSWHVVVLVFDQHNLAVSTSVDTVALQICESVGR
jgi:hypothetical protein